MSCQMKVPAWAEEFVDFYGCGYEGGASRFDDISVSADGVKKARAAQGNIVFLPTSPRDVSGWMRRAENWGIPYRIKWTYSAKDTEKIFSSPRLARFYGFIDDTVAKDAPPKIVKSFKDKNMHESCKPVGWDGKSERLLFALAPFSGKESVEALVSFAESGGNIMEGWNSSLFTIIAYHSDETVDIVDAFSRLIDAGVSPTHRNENGNDALLSFLMNAADNRKPSVERMLDLLVSAGVPLDTKNKRGYGVMEMIGFNRGDAFSSEERADAAFLGFLMAKRESDALSVGRIPQTVKSRKGI